MFLIEYQDQIYKVPIERTTKQDNTKEKVENEYEYVIRGLREDEVKEWSEFCASVFSYKPDPPPSEYFYRHYVNDPNTKAYDGSSRLIRVALFEGTIVASCRIFLRTITGTNGVLRAGGIGEVCTAMNHRRRGLSAKILENAIAIMKDRDDLQVSSLHAARLPTGWVVVCMLTHAILKLEGESSSLLLAAKAKAETTSDMAFLLTLPGFLKDKMGTYRASSVLRFDWASERTSIDRGWMYRGLGASRGNSTTNSSTVADGFLDFVRGIAIPSEQPRREHFVWPSDSF
jgi:hypothetical protein